MLGQPPALTRAALHSVLQPQPPNQREAGRVGVAGLGWAGQGCGSSLSPVFRDALGAQTAAASLGPAEVRGKQRTGHLDAPWGDTGLGYQPPCSGPT